jgi:hypothetical protein
MLFQIRTEKDTVHVYADVTKIEVEDIVKTSEDDIVENCYRTIRFVSGNGETIEVFCEAGEEKDLTLQPAPKEKPDKAGWLKPKVYK